MLDINNNNNKIKKRKVSKQKFVCNSLLIWLVVRLVVVVLLLHIFVHNIDIAPKNEVTCSLLFQFLQYICTLWCTDFCYIMKQACKVLNKIVYRL